MIVFTSYMYVLMIQMLQMCDDFKKPGPAGIPHQAGRLLDWNDIEWLL